MSDPTKVLLGATRSTDRVIDNKKGSIPAGTVTRLKSDGTITVDDGGVLGVSLGKDLSDAGRTAIVRRGLSVPVLLTGAFEPTLGAQVHIADATGLAIASGEGATGVNATYASGVLTGVKEDGTEAPCALIDMPGGL